jgi:hypothetical protein
MRTEIIIRATRTQNVLGEKGRRIRELTSLVQKRFGFAEGSVELYAEKVGPDLRQQHIRRILVVIIRNTVILSRGDVEEELSNLRPPPPVRSERATTTSLELLRLLWCQPVTRPALFDSSGDPVTRRASFV